MSEAELREILETALAQCVRRAGKDEIFAASLASEVTGILRQRRNDPWVTFGMDMYGDFVRECGIALGPRGARFREFLLCFPDLIQVTATGSGDIVKWLRAGDILTELQRKREALAQSAKATLEDFRKEGHSIVSASKLALRMKGLFNEVVLRSLGYDSLLTFLSNVAGVEVDRDAPGGKVWLTGATKGSIGPAIGFLLVDSEDIWKTLERLLGRNPEEDERPDWTRIMEWAEREYPATEWKRPYFLRESFAAQANLKPFLHVLSRIGYRPTNPSSPHYGGPSSNRELERDAVIKMAIKTIDSAFEHHSRLIVLSHNDEILRHLWEKQVIPIKPVVVGFLDRMPDFVRANSKIAMLADLEHDVHAFPSAMPRSLSVSPEEFDPMKHL